MDVLLLHDGGCSTPRLPERGLKADALQVLASAVAHAIGGCLVLAIALITGAPSSPARPGTVVVPPSIDISRIVFIAREQPISGGGGGGGGGNQQSGPIRRAHGIGRDAITLRIAKPIATDEKEMDTPLPALLLNAKPLASGSFEQTGLPDGGVPAGISTGPGRGGGVGDGVGIGIGPGRGPGMGDGSDGGIGGGVYRPGGSVTSPRVITQVKPTYTADAMDHRISGTVVLEAVITTDGRPTKIRVIRSLDPGGLDRQAALAASQWRFEPGRLNGTPVDVLVTIWLDFTIR
jgi:periplasmic protein TonB